MPSLDMIWVYMQEYRQQQFDLLADGVRRALDMNALYAAMGLEGRNTV